MATSMSSRERMLAAITMKELPDQVPVVPLLMTRAIREGNITCDVAQTNPEAMAAAKMKAVEKFGGDVIIAGTDLFLSVENFGAELDYLPHAQPSLVKHPCSTKDDFYRVRDEYYKKGFNPNKGRIAYVAEEIRIYVKNGWKSHHVVVAPTGGPIQTAQLMTGASDFLTYLQEDPEYAKEVIALALDNVKNVCTIFFEAGLDGINILEPFCSSDIIPPEMYREFALPAQKEVMAHIASLGGVGMTHICTFTQPIWRDMATNGCKIVNGDFYPGMDHAKRAIGGEICLMGSLSPFSTLVDGTPEDVALEVKKHAAEVGYNGGFILMPGCDIDWNIPEENLRAMIDTCASIKYPMDVEALGDLSRVFLPGQPGHRGKRALSTAGDNAVSSVRSGEAARAKPATPADEVYEKLIEAIMEYDGDKAIEWTQKGLDRGMTAQQIVFDGLSQGMKIVGDMYERNERFVTDMLKAAKTMDKAMPLLTPLLEASGKNDGGATGTVVVGLVRGNTQDIGKNLVCLMLKASGFDVVDLGKNVKPETFIEEAEKRNAIAIGMSVMTNSSTVYVEKVVDLLRNQGKFDKYLVMCGGAAANKGFAENAGIKYGSDANRAVSLVQEYVQARAASN